MTIIRNIFVLCGMLLVVFSTSVAEIYASTTTTASCSVADVSAAITSASRGDTVLVPAGSCTWSSSLKITKGLKLQGAGIGSTVITSSQSSMISYQPDATAITNNERFEVSGFTLTSTITSGGSGAIFVTTPAAALPISNVVIHHNRLVTGTTTPLGQKAIHIVGTIYGVAYLNEFHGQYALDALNQLGYQDWLNYPAQAGTSKAFYLEDNLFEVTPFPYNESGQGGSMYVFRYNTINLGAAAENGDMWDMHGDQGAGSGKGLEAYGNNFTNCSIPNRVTVQRGGTGRVFFNKSNCSSSNWVAEWHQCGPEQVMNTYYWNNYYGGALVRANEDTTNNTGCLTENVHYWNHNLSYNGSSQRGIFVGSALPAVCTSGDGAWITTQTVGGSMTGMVGQNPTTPITGTLYRCGSGNSWASYYTPYTYPHPLRTGTGGGSDATPPAPPTGVRIL